MLKSGSSCQPMLGICDILVRIQMRSRILGSIPLIIESGCGSGMPKNIWILRIRNNGKKS